MGDDVMGKSVKHPSFGYIKLNRVSSNGARLFMSDLKHRNFVTLEIGHAELNRNHHHEQHFARGEIIEIALSEMQLGQLLSSMNEGNGIPCTLVRHEHKEIEPPPRNPFMEKFDAEVKADFDEIRDQITLLKNKLQDSVDSSKPMGQKEKLALLEMARMMEQHVASNVPFVMKQFKEKMEDVVAQAKTEIQAFGQRALSGQAALQAPVTLELDAKKEE